MFLAEAWTAADCVLSISPAVFRATATRAGSALWTDDDRSSYNLKCAPAAKTLNPEGIIPSGFSVKPQRTRADLRILENRSGSGKALPEPCLGLVGPLCPAALPTTDETFGASDDRREII